MSDNRIITPNGETTPPTPQPLNMDDLLNRANAAWKFKQKDEAIQYMIAGMRLLSQGIGEIFHEIEAMKKGKDEHKE